MGVVPKRRTMLPSLFFFFSFFFSSSPFLQERDLSPHSVVTNGCGASVLVTRVTLEQPVFCCQQPCMFQDMLFYFYWHFSLCKSSGKVTKFISVVPSLLTPAGYYLGELSQAATSVTTTIGQAGGGWCLGIPWNTGLQFPPDITQDIYLVG